MGILFTDPTPLYLQIASDIKNQIFQGKYKIHDPLGSQKQLAKEYDVSLITVKKALQLLIEEGILYSRIGKGTFVATINSKNIQSNDTIGIVLRDLQSPFFSRIVDSIERQATSLNMDILVKTSSNLAENEDEQIQYFLDIGVKGIIIASMSHNYKPTSLISTLHKNRFPYVVVSYMDDPSIYFVGTDHEKGGYIATEHLIKVGYKSIGYINGESGNIPGMLRYKGYLQALRQYNLEVNPKYNFALDHHTISQEFEHGYAVGQKISNLSNLPEAFFIFNDLSALGFQKAVIEKGIRIPEDIAIVGFDNINRSSAAQVPLTTVAQPTENIGSIAVQSINKRINKQDSGVRTILEPELVIRESCGYKKLG